VQVTLPGGGKLGVYQALHARPDAGSAKTQAKSKPAAKSKPTAKSKPAAKSKPTAKSKPARAKTKKKAR
jgi:hypothetical protein